MSPPVTAKAAGIHPGDYFRDVLLRVSTGTDEKKFTPHGWKDHFKGRGHRLASRPAAGTRRRALRHARHDGCEATVTTGWQR